MCFSLYISTDSPEDLRSCTTELVRFQKAEDYEYKATEFISILQFPNRWFVGSKSGCSCTFRHLHCSAVDLGFGAPEGWYEEGQDNLDATQQLYQVIHNLLRSGFRLDCIDHWAGAEPKDITVLPVSLQAVSKEAFRLFENYRFVFEPPPNPLD
jgi:hypothetical protein